jgi:hypothetical protein
MTATTTPTNLLASEDPGGEWLVQNLGTEPIYVARSEGACTPTQGVRISAGQAIGFDSPLREYNGGAEIWVCTSTGTADVRVLRIG